jgi:hypothetical protein
MADKPFQHAKPRAFLADQGAGRVGCDALVGAGLQELAKSSATSKKLFCPAWKHA